MTAEWVSAVSNAIVAVLTIGFLILGVIGLKSWKHQVKADHEINRRDWAGDMIAAVSNLSKHVAALRLGRVSPTDLLEGTAKLDEIGVYRNAAPAQSVEVLDRLMQVLWQVFHRGLTYADTEADSNARLAEVKKFTAAVSAFRVAFCQKHFGRVVYIHTNEGIEAKDDTGRDLLKMDITILRPESGPDPFGARLEEAAAVLVRRYSALAVQGK